MIHEATEGYIDVGDRCWKRNIVTNIIFTASGPDIYATKYDTSIVWLKNSIEIVTILGDFSR